MDIVISYSKAEDSGKGQALLELAGRFDNASAPACEARLDEVLAASDTVLFDFSHVDYISSAGLRVLLIYKKRLGSGLVVIRGANEVVREVLDMSGFSGILKVE